MVRLCTAMSEADGRRRVRSLAADSMVVTNRQVRDECFLGGTKSGMPHLAIVFIFLVRN